MQASETQHCNIIRPGPSTILWFWEVLHFLLVKTLILALPWCFFSNALKITSLFSFQWTLLPPSLLYMWIGPCLECWRRASVSPRFITSPNSLIITYSQSHMDLIHCSSESFRAEHAAGLSISEAVRVSSGPRPPDEEDYTVAADEWHRGSHMD